TNFSDLGLFVKEVTLDQIRAGGFREDVRGLMIDSVQPGSPAAAAGLQKGMIVEKVGMKNVASVEEFNNAGTNISVNNGVLLYIHTRSGSKFVAVGPDEI